MLSEKDATDVITKAMPRCRIVGPVDHEGLYLFQAFRDFDPLEGDMDPYVSVDQRTGEAREFSIMVANNPHAIESKFLTFKGDTHAR